MKKRSRREAITGIVVGEAPILVADRSVEVNSANVNWAQVNARVDAHRLA
jgi:hypothetical protein